MLSFGWSELLLVLGLVVVLIRPREFPAFFRTLHQLFKVVRNYVHHIKGQFSGFAEDMEIEAMRVERFDRAKKIDASSETKKKSPRNKSITKASS